MAKPKKWDTMTPEEQEAWMEKRRHWERESRKSNPERKRKADRKYIDANPEKRRETNTKNFRKRYKASPEKYREWMRKHREQSKKQSAADSFFQLQAAALQISTALETKTKTKPTT